jgi:endonuclease/exonuclease/phosphatase (EEP) superfamily protein YafD
MRSAEEGSKGIMRDTVYCVLCVLITLALAILSMRYVSDLWLLAFFESLQTHFALACIIGALLAFLIKRHWYALLLIAVGAALAIHSVVMLREHAAAAPAEDARPSYRLLSFNIDNDNFANGERIADLVIASKADVVEIFEAAPLLSQMSRIAQTYPYRIGCGVMTSDCDSLLLSKRPFLQQRIRSLSDLWRDRFILAAIDLDGQPVNFASAHLSKPYFDEFHNMELMVLYYILYFTKGPLILAGDFNASVIAPDMRDFLGRSNLRHVFPEPATWPIEAGAYGIGIDHVFARPPVELKSVKRIEDAMGSNHYGLITEFTVAK